MSEACRILIVEDEHILREYLSKILKDEGYEIVTAKRGEEAKILFQQSCFNIAIIDIKLPDINGLELLHIIKQLNQDICIIMITAYATTETAIRALEEGAYDYFTKPLDFDRMKTVVKRGLEKQKLAIRNRELLGNLERATRELNKLCKKEYGFENIIGKSLEMQNVYNLMQKVLNTDTTILILGETGTGKELVARAIHYNGNRAQQSFYPIACAGIQEQLLESELFGHEKGAFTGADKRKLGIFEVANKGTIFLDEISETSQTVQARLLRVLQEKEFTRLGGTEVIKVDVRLIAATNRDLEKMVKEGKFREDLFYRLNVVPINIPPLRNRKEDIPLLAYYFLEKYSNKMKKELKAFSQETINFLISYSWPGNVRELENVVEYAVTLVTQSIIQPQDIPDKIRNEVSSGSLVFTNISYKQTKAKLVSSFEKNFIIQSLKDSGGNVTKAAKKVNLSRGSFQKIMKKHGIKSKEYKMS